MLHFPTLSGHLDFSIPLKDKSRFQVEIRRTIDGEKFSISESSAVKKWGTEKVALQQAKKRRNQKLDELDAGIITTADKALLNCSVNDLMERLPALLGWTVETTQNKNRLYNKRINPKYGQRNFVAFVLKISN